MRCCQPILFLCHTKPSLSLLLHIPASRSGLAVTKSLPTLRGSIRTCAAPCFALESEFCRHTAVHSSWGETWGVFDTTTPSHPPVSWVGRSSSDLTRPRNIFRSVYNPRSKPTFARGPAGVTKPRLSLQMQKYS